MHFNAFSQHKTSDEIIGDFKVDRIERIKDNYIIYATHSDTLYKVVSQKTFKSKAEKIKQGETYTFHLVSFFKEIQFATSIINSIEVSPGCVVRRLDETKQLYYCLNITGLYFIPLTHLYHNQNLLIYYPSVPGYFSHNYHNQDSLTCYPSVSGYFKIQKIHLKKSVYLIEAVKDSITYWIASPKTGYSSNRLKKNSIYYLGIMSYYEKYNNFSRIIDGSVEVRPKTLIKPNPITGQLYFSFDIISNCYIRPNRFSKE